MKSLRQVLYSKGGSRNGRKTKFGKTNFETFLLHSISEKAVMVFECPFYLEIPPKKFRHQEIEVDKLKSQQHKHKSRMNLKKGFASLQKFFVILEFICRYGVLRCLCRRSRCVSEKSRSAENASRALVQSEAARE